MARYCTKCGKKLDDNDMFCFACGVKFRHHDNNDSVVPVLNEDTINEAPETVFVSDVDISTLSQEQFYNFIKVCKIKVAMRIYSIAIILAVIFAGWSSHINVSHDPSKSFALLFGSQLVLLLVVFVILATIIVALGVYVALNIYLRKNPQYIKQILSDEEMQVNLMVSQK